MASIGEAPYEWSIDSDVLAWGANATEVLSVGGLAVDLERAQLRQAARAPMRRPAASMR